MSRKDSEMLGGKKTEIKRGNEMMEGVVGIKVVGKD